MELCSNIRIFKMLYSRCHIISTRAAVATLPQLLPTRTSSTTTSSASSSCHLPVLDPWHPAILPYVSDKPSLVQNCSREKVCLTNQQVVGVLQTSEVPGLHWIQLPGCQLDCSRRAQSPKKPGVVPYAWRWRYWIDPGLLKHFCLCPWWLLYGWCTAGGQD